MIPYTLFLRLEGPMQAWGNQESKFVIRRTAEAPTKSGVIGLLCAAMGIGRIQTAEEDWLSKLSDLKMGVRIDRPGVRWWDYHTVGAKMKMRIAKGEGETKPGAMLTRREYLCDASFLLVLQGEPALITDLETALKSPKWTLYLGRKCCPPSRPLLEKDAVGTFSDLLSALQSFPWRPRLKWDKQPESIECLIDWIPTPEQPEAPENAEIWYDIPMTFDPPSHYARFVIHRRLNVGLDGELQVENEPLQQLAKAPPRPRADYTNSEYKKIRKERLNYDQHLCVFCKSPATTVQHVTYRHAGGDERLEELRSLCHLCHDAVTMIEYGLGMGMDRINPEELRGRDLIIEKRQEIINYRSLETRRRRLSAEEVE